ncbi:retention module-containing protein, partial [Halomonas sp. I1]|uniref:retention module-containing protein n=1 Tax=Halomonas sp. I1 TaxID=393536 RepID=UPI0028DDF08D
MSDMTVVELSGQAWVRDENGNLRELERGDVIASDETVVTADNASLVLAPASGEPVQVPPGAELNPESLMAADDDDRPEASVGEASSEDSRGGDASPSSADQNPQNNLSEAQNSGPSDRHGSTPTIHEGQSFVRVDRIKEPVDPLEYQYGLEMGDWLETRRGGAQDDNEEDEDRATSSRTPDEMPAARVELLGAGDDGIYNQDEIGDDGSVTARVTLNSNTEPGDQLVVTDGHGNVLIDRPVTQEDLDNGVTVEVPVEPGDAEVGVHASVTDEAGRGGGDTDRKPIEESDDTSPAVSVELTGSGDDGTYNQDEIGDDGTVTAQVTLEDGTEVGDTLTVTDKDGNVLEEREVTQDDLDNGVSVEVPVEPGDPDVSVTAKVTDPAGNSDSDDDSKPIDWDVAVNVPNEHDADTPDGNIADQVVFESGLADGSATNADDTRVESSFTLTALDGLQETGAVTL